MKKMILIAALLLAAIAPLRAQDFIRVNDTTWIRLTETSTDYAAPINQSALAVQLNNDMRSAALCQLGALCTASITGIEAYRYSQKKTDIRRFGVVAFGLATVCLEVASICELYQKRVYLTPGGVILKIGKSEKKPKK